MPRHSRGDLPGVGVYAVDQNVGEGTAVLVAAVLHERHGLPFHERGKIVARPAAERLLELGRVDALEAHLERLPVVGPHGDGVTVVNADDLARGRGRRHGEGLAGDEAEHEHGGGADHAASLVERPR